MATNKVMRTLTITVFIHILVFSGLHILMYKNIGYGLASAGDYGNVNQALWSTLHGRFFEGTTQSYQFGTLGPYNHFADHFEPIYLFLLPLYALWPATEALIFFKALFLALAAIPLYLIAKDKLGDIAGLIISSAYLLSPIVALQMYYPTHAEEYAPFFIVFAFYFFQKQRFKWFIIFILLLALVRESMPITIFMFGIYALLKKRPLKWSLPLMIGSLIYFIAVSYVIMPFLANYSKTAPHRLFVTKALSISGIYGIIQQTFSSRLWGSLIRYLVPFGLIFPLLSSIVIFMIPEIFLKFGILGAELGTRHYSVVLTTYIFISLVYFLKNLSVFYSKRIGVEKAKKIIVYASIILLISMAYRSKGFLNPYYYMRKPYYEAQRAAIRFIPPDASVTVPDYLVGYLSSRFKLDQISRSREFCKYSDISRGYDYLIVDTHPENSKGFELKRIKELIEIMPKRRDYKLVFEKDGILIYKKIRES